MKSKTNLVLSVKPFCRGFAFALFEAPQSPTDWGVRDIRGKAKNALTLLGIKQIITQYQPDVLLLPAPEGRSERIRKLVRDIAALAIKQGIPAHTVTRADIRAAFATDLPGGGTAGRAFFKPTRYQIAQAIANRFAFFAAQLPPPRRFYDSEDARMSLFDAVSAAVSHYAGQKAGGGK